MTGSWWDISSRVLLLPLNQPESVNTSGGTLAAPVIWKGLQKNRINVLLRTNPPWQRNGWDGLQVLNHP